MTTAPSPSLALAVPPSPMLHALDLLGGVAAPRRASIVWGRHLPTSEVDAEGHRHLSSRDPDGRLKGGA